MLAFPTCRRCQSGAEIREHLFRECPSTKETWEQWVALMGSRLKINFDAAFNNHKKELCFGLVIRNEEARVICSKTVMNTNILFVFAAEAVACVQALNLGLQLGLREVETEGDSWSVVRKLQEKMNDRS
ncbi:uncharacterized protein [Gossypium hirsutum]|uniref:RNase H type-1 domain-containing protein n=1 Tax=Gossypium hirsutum TaxID=3635 RepID=A0ABM2Z3D3_GOSHI|nr:uncharacterized protein LOC121209792 [Gossypium hirsutum]